MLSNSLLGDNRPGEAPFTANPLFQRPLTWSPLSIKSMTRQKTGAKIMVQRRIGKTITMMKMTDPSKVLKRRKLLSLRWASVASSIINTTISVRTTMIWKHSIAISWRKRSKPESKARKKTWKNI